MWNSMSTKKLGRTLNWRFTQATMVPWSTDCPTTKSRLAMNEKSSRRKICSCTLGSRRLTFLPTNRSCSQGGLDEWREVKWDRDVYCRISRRQWEMTYLRQHHLHCQCVVYCCTKHGSIFEWKLETLCVLSCKQTHPVKCSLDLWKDKNVMDGSGDYMEPWMACERTGVRPDLMFATKCLSYKLASPTLADLTRAKKALRNLKGTRELNLYSTIPALKPNDLNKTLKHVTGYYDADWAVDEEKHILHSVLRSRTGTVAVPSGDSELYALGALSAELIFAQAIQKEIGLSFLIHARADSSTARAVATKQGASRKMKHFDTRFSFIQALVFRKLLTMSSVKTDVNPSDIGTKALGRERLYRLRSMLDMVTELSEQVPLVTGTMEMEWQRRVASRTYGGSDESNDRHMWASVDFVNFSVQRGTPRESDTASRREEACLFKPCNVVALLVTSQPVTVDTTVTFFSHSDVLGPSRITRK